MKFNLTEKWRARILNLISEQDLLEVSIVRTGRNRFKMYAGMDGEKIFEMDSFKLNVNDEFLLKDCKITFSMAR